MRLGDQIEELYRRAWSYLTPARRAQLAQVALDARSCQLPVIVAVSNENDWDNLSERIQCSLRMTLDDEDIIFPP